MTYIEIYSNLLNMKDKNFTYDIRFLVDKSLFEKAKQMRKEGINLSQILRNFLEEYQYKQS